MTPKHPAVPPRRPAPPLTCRLYAYSGTGNSLWAARCLSSSWTGSECVRMDPEAPAASEPEAVGLVFPVHMWGLPRRVLKMIDRLAWSPSAYIFAVAVNAGQVAATLLQLRDELARRGRKLSAGFSLEMPSNYLPWGEAVGDPERSEIYARAEEKLRQIGGRIARRETPPLEKGPLWQNVLFSGLYRLSFPVVPKMDKDFTIDATCNGCGICGRICPADNIRLVGKRPIWRHRCEQCLACLHWCPRTAIQLGKKTAAYRRYHHPAVRLQDWLPAGPDAPAGRKR